MGFLRPGLPVLGAGAAASLGIPNGTRLMVICAHARERRRVRHRRWLPRTARGLRCLFLRCAIALPARAAGLPLYWSADASCFHGLPTTPLVAATAWRRTIEHCEYARRPSQKLVGFCAPGVEFGWLYELLVLIVGLIRVLRCRELQLRSKFKLLGYNPLT